MLPETPQARHSAINELLAELTTQIAAYRAALRRIVDIADLSSCHSDQARIAAARRVAEQALEETRP
jgi:alkylation response protein AidB-like acyl-CoA dehydrogenase